MTTKEEARAIIEADKARFDAKRQKGIDLLSQHRQKYGDTKCLVLVYFQPEVKRRPWYAVVLHPNTRGGGGECQRSWFDAQGFSGHEVFATYEEAAADAYIMGFRHPAPNLLDLVSLTPEFQAGNTWSMLPDDQKWTTTISDILKEIKGESRSKQKPR